MSQDGYNDKFDDQYDDQYRDQQEDNYEHAEHDPDRDHYQPEGGGRKQGTSTTVKVLIILLVIACLCGCICCGIGFWIVSKQKVSDDPEATRQTAKEILGTEIPEDVFVPQATVNFEFFGLFNMKMAAFSAKDVEGECFLMEMKIANQEGNEQALEDQLRQQNPGQQRNLTVDFKSIEEIKVKARDRELTFQIFKAKDQQGKDFRQIRGTFPGTESDSTALLIIQIEEKGYDAAKIRSLLESIK